MFSFLVFTLAPFPIFPFAGPKFPRKSRAARPGGQHREGTHTHNWVLLARCRDRRWLPSSEPQLFFVPDVHDHRLARQTNANLYFLTDNYLHTGRSLPTSIQ